MNLTGEVQRAVRYFWQMRSRQSRRQGTRTGRRDQGLRSAVTGGKQMLGFQRLLRKILIGAGVPPAAMFFDRSVELPGYFRAEKKWDLIVVRKSELLAVAELKSHIGPSFGNNYNNRAEEAIGNAQDIWIAFREKAFKSSRAPWLGYLMLLEEAPGSTQPVSVQEPHFAVFPEFRNASYARRYELLIDRLLRERLYTAGCLLFSSARDGLSAGTYREPSPNTGFVGFVRSLTAHIRARQ